MDGPELRSHRERAATDPARPAAGDGDAPALACRRIKASETAAVVDLLCEGFPERSRAYWAQAMDRLARRRVPDSGPQFGYVLTDHSRLVGIVLLILSEGPAGRRGNVSSWYVRPAYRSFSHMLMSLPLRLKETILVNISPAPNTIATIGAQGFVEYSHGSFAAAAALARSVPGARLTDATSTDRNAILADHCGWNCIGVTVEHEGAAYPFVFTRSRFLAGRLPCAQLVYCPSIDDFARFAGPLGRHLLRHGLPLVMIDALGPIAGVPGVYRVTRGRRFYRGGGGAPRPGDLSYTELAIFGS